MATVVIPAPPPTVPPLEADAQASGVADALRRAGTTTSAVADWAHDSGAPADWSGDAAEGEGPEGLLGSIIQPAMTTSEGAADLHEHRRQDARSLFEGLSPR